MTPTNQDLRLAPLVTHVDPLSHHYHRAARIWKETQPARSFLHRALRFAGTILRLDARPILQHAPRRMFATLVHAHKLLDCLGNGITTFLYESIIAVIRTLAAAVIVLGLLLLLQFGLNADNRQSITETAPTRTSLALEAGAKPLPAAAPKKAPIAKPPTTRLARFPGSAQRFPTEREQIDALADALNIPSAVVRHNVNRALDLARTNARAMRKHTGRFPLPKGTPDRLLAALTPADVAKLAVLLGHATTIDKRSFTLRADLSSGDLVLDARVTAMANTSAAGACFRYALAFSRRTFRHAITVAACRRRAAWTFLTPTSKGK